MELNQEDYLETVLSPMGNHSIFKLKRRQPQIQYKKRNKSKTVK